MEGRSEDIEELGSARTLEDCSGSGWMEEYTDEKRFWILKFLGNSFFFFF